MNVDSVHLIYIQIEGNIERTEPQVDSSYVELLQIHYIIQAVIPAFDNI